MTKFAFLLRSSGWRRVLKARNPFRLITLYPIVINIYGLLLTLPLSSYIDKLLTTRKMNASSDYVFSSPGAKGYIVEPRRQMSKVTEASGINFTIHDLRRTFITIAESLDIPAYVLKRLLNHKMNHDVTSGYIISDVERLRKPMQQITDFILQSFKPEGIYGQE